MKINLLRQKILDLAIRGKLVPQDPNDEPASVLLERIRAEKDRLIAEGKIKRPKKAKATSSESHYQKFTPPFDIPESWEWVTVGTLLTNRDAERIPVSSAIRKKQINKIYDYYGAAGIIDKVENYLFNEKLLLIGEDGANLLSRAKDNAFLAEGKYWVNNHAHILDCLDKSILEYVAYVINSYDLESYITGSAQPKLSQDNLNRIPIPLPPLSEQQRIVSEIETCLMLIDQIDGNRSDLQTAVINTKSKILDLAMQGKLVPQDPADEPAADMLRRINPKAKIITDNPQYQQFTPPFDIPESWQWVRLDEICSIKGGKRIPRGKSFAKEKTSHAYLRVTDMKNNTIETSDLKYIDDEVFEQIKNYTINTTDLYLTIAGTIGSVGIIPPEVDGMNLTENAAKLTDISCDKVYLLYSLSSSFAQEHFSSRFHQVAQPKLSIETASSTFIPVPPLNEQKRIVAKIKELFSVLDTIEASLQS